MADQYDGLGLAEYRQRRVTAAADGEERIPQEVVRQARVRERECGDCRLCCKILAIEDDDGTMVTSRGAWCEEAGPGGCAIHESGQPAVCARFLCAWRGGFLEDAERPDRVRAVPILQDGAPVGAAIVWHTPGEAELSKKAQKAAQRMLDGKDPSLVHALPQMICRKGVTMETLVLPGQTMAGSRGLPSDREVERYNGILLRKLAAAKAIPDG